MVGRLSLDELEALALFADHDRAFEPDRFDGRVLLREPGFAKLFAKFERRAVQRRHFVIGLDQKVGDAEGVKGGQQMLDGADRASTAGQRGVVAGVGYVLEAQGNRSLVGERRKYDSKSGRRGMENYAGLEAGVKPLPAHHDRARHGSLRKRTGANRIAAGSAGLRAESARA